MSDELQRGAMSVDRPAPPCTPHPRGHCALTQRGSRRPKPHAFLPVLSFWPVPEYSVPYPVKRTPVGASLPLGGGGGGDDDGDGEGVGEGITGGGTMGGSVTGGGSSGPVPLGSTGTVVVGP